jgi:hypothetical protein
MSPSVRVKRRHAYSSIQDDDRYRPEQPHDNQPESGRRALSEPSPSGASGSLPPPVPPLDPNLSQNLPVPRRDMSRVNHHTRSSFSYRSFATDLESNPADSPATYGQSQDVPLRETTPEGTSTDPAVPHPHRPHPLRVSRVRSALSSPSGSHRDSDSDSESDSEDEDGTMEDDEHHHDDQVVDHLDVIGPPPSHVLSISFLTLFLHRPPSRHGRDSYEHCERHSSVISPFLTTSMFPLTLPQPTPLVLQSQASPYPSAWARARRRRRFSSHR